MVLEVPWIAAIAIGGGLLLFIFGYIGATWLIFKAHKRKMAELERQIIASEIGAPLECANIARPPMTLRKSVQLANNTGAGWGVLPSNETLHEDYQKGAKRRPDKRKSDLLSWPLPRRKSTKRKLSLKRLRTTRLSTVVESPRTDRSKSVFDDMAKGAMLEMSPDTNRISAFPIAEPTVMHSNISRSHSPDPNVSPSEALRPGPLRFSKRGSELLASSEDRPPLDRSATVPTILIGSDDGIFGDARRTSGQNARHSRSISFGQSSMAPNVPPPPLPVVVPPQQLRPQPSLVRTMSNDSVASSESVGSSLLQTSSSPNMRARNEFSQRHPEMGLVPQVRESNPKLKDELLSGQRNTQVSTSMRKSPRMTSFAGSLLDEAAAGTKVPARTSNLAGTKQQVTSRDIQMPASGDLGERASPNNEDEQNIRVLSTPTRRDSQVRKVSDSFGSPMERGKKRSGTLHPILTNTQLLSREPSQTSLQSSESSATDANPFKWETDSPVAKRQSVLKGSPNARKSHRRLNSVRISMTPTYYGPASRSSSRMFEIAEEGGSSPLNPFEEVDITHQPPSVSNFEPNLKNPTAYRASLKTETPDLPMTEFKDNENIFARHNDRNSSRSPDRRLSKASSVLSIPSFPTHDEKLAGDSNGGFDEVPTFGSPTNFSKPTRPMIPGLTTLRGNGQGQQELQYPTIDLSTSPGSSPYGVEQSSTAPTEAPASPTERLHQALAAHANAAALPRSLSPSPKASPTTHVSKEQSSFAASAILPKPKPVTTNPLDTKPNFSPTESAASMPPHHPLGPRAAPAPSIMRTVKGLRRDNSEAFLSIDSRSSQRYLSLGRSPSNISNISTNSLASSPILATFQRLDINDEDEKENMPPQRSFEEYVGRASEEGKGMSKAEKRKGLNFETPSPKLMANGGRPGGKNVTWGPVAFSETPIGATPASLYDANGFYIGEDSPC